MTITSSINSCLYRPIYSPLNKKLAILDGSAGGAFSPDDIPTILQNLGSPLTYAASPLGSIPVLESSIGEVGTPRGQSCVKFDGSNDYLTLGARLTSGAVTALTVCAKVKTAVTGAARIIAQEWNPDSNNRSWAIFDQGFSNIRFICSSNGSTTATVTTANSTLPVGQWTTVCVVFNAGAVKIYLNGVEVSTTVSGTIPASLFDGNGHFRLGCSGSNATPSDFFNGSISDPRVYSDAKDAAFALAHHNQHLTPDTVDRTNAIAIWPLQDESGTKCYDVSGNGNDLTATNVTVGTFRTTDSGVKYSFPNQFGYTNNAGVIIPADLDNPTLDCEGDALETPGPIWLPGVMEVPCVTFSGTDYATLGARLLPASTPNTTICGRIFQATRTANKAIAAEYVNGNNATVYLGTTATGFEVYFYSLGSQYVGLVCNSVFLDGIDYHIAVTLNGSTITAYVDGSVISGTPISSGGFTGISPTPTAPFQLGAYNGGSSLLGRLSDWRVHSDTKSDAEVLAISQGYDDRTNLLAHWGCQDGPGDDNDNRTIHDNSGNGHHLTVTNGTVSTQWANRTVVVKDQCIVAGGGIAANGSFVPGIPGSANDAAGNVKTLAVGKKNPYSNLLRNYFSAPSLVNIGITSSDRLNQYKCVTGNGSDNWIDLGSGDDFAVTSGGGVDIPFEIELNVYSTGTRGTFFSRDNYATGLVGYSAGLYDGFVYFTLCSGSGSYIGRTAPLTTSTWHKLKFIYDGSKANSGIQIFNNGIRVDSGDYSAGTYAGVPVATTPMRLMRVSLLTNVWFTGRISSFKFTKSGVTKAIPITDGSGADVACFTDGVMSVISNAIQGTLTNVWANNTNGQFVVPYGLQAAVTRQTKFSGDAEKYLAFREEQTGTNLANIEEWTQ